MFRFLATLIATGVGVLAAVTWWSERSPAGPWPSFPSLEAPGRAVAPREAEPRAPAARPSRLGPAPAGPEPVRAASARKDPGPEPAVAPRRVPAIPAPKLAPRDVSTRVVAPARGAPEPIPAPRRAPPKAAGGVGETRIPDPVTFEDEGVALANGAEPAAPGADPFDSGEESYGEENVIYVEGDDAFPEPAADPRAVAMSSDHDASAERIRRLLEVYQSLGSRR